MKTVAAWLEAVRAEVVRQVVERTQAELSDYRQREPGELTTAVEKAFDVWRGAILYDDFDSHLAHSHRVIQENMARRIHPEQIARTPWLIYEVTLALVDEADGQISRMERATFVARAHRTTVRITLVGNMEISENLIKRAPRPPAPYTPPVGEA